MHTYTYITYIHTYTYIYIHTYIHTHTKRLQSYLFCASYLYLIQKFDISVLDFHKEWNDQIESDHTDNVVATNVKSVRWSDKLGGSLTDIRTYKLSPTEIRQKRICARAIARTIRKQRKQHDQVGPETLFLNPLF